MPNESQVSADQGADDQGDGDNQEGPRRVERDHQRQIGAISQVLEHNQVTAVLGAADVSSAQAEGRTGVFLGCEGADFLDGDCGGLCACATCHVYIPEEWDSHCGEPDELEQNILDFAFDVQDNSRLACQIKVSDDIEGIRVLMPERQY